MFLPSYSQNKKEQIPSFKSDIDSLNQVIFKNEKIFQDQLDLSRKVSEDLKKQNLSLNDKIKMLQSEINQLKSELSILERDNTNLKTNIFNLELEIEKFKKVDLANWLKNNLKFNVESSKIANNTIELNSYRNDISSELKNELNEGGFGYWNLENDSIVEVVNEKAGIIFDLTNNDLNKHLVLTADFIIISYYTWPNEFSSLIYNISIQKMESYDFEVTGLISYNLLKVFKGYYDKREINDSKYEGHIFETGSFNLLDGKYTFISKD
jgi:hypothetical protein